MSKIVFINAPEIIYDCKFSQIGVHQIRLEFDSTLPEPNVYLSGCCLINEHNHSLIQTNREGYTHLYRTYDEYPNIIELCDDGIAYVEPEQIPYEPTPEELEAQFNQNKKQKIELSKLMLADFLESNPLHSSAHDGVDGVYSVTSEKQSLMMRQYMTYQIAKSVDPDAKLTWNETGKFCTEWTEEEFLQLILEIKAYVYPLVSYQQYIEEKICSCHNQEELDKILIDYGNITGQN